MNLKPSPTKPQFAPFDKFASLPIIRVIKPVYEWKRGLWIYLFLGITVVVVDTVLSLVLTKVLINATVANTIAWVLSTFTGFNLFRYFYFDRTNNSYINEMFKFFPTRLVPLAIRAIVVFIFVDKMGVNQLPVKLILVPVEAIINYITSKLIVFKNK